MVSQRKCKIQSTVFVMKVCSEADLFQQPANGD